MRACHESGLHINGMHTFLAHLDQGNRFFTYISLIIEFKGILMKLKNVALAISVEKRIFIVFVDVSQLGYKPLNFARANKPYAVG